MNKFFRQTNGEDEVDDVEQHEIHTTTRNA